MSKTVLGVCVTLPGAEEQARRSIEHNGFGTRALSFRSSYYRQGKRYVRLRALFPGYVFPELSAGWGMITGTEGVRLVLMSNGKPMVIAGKDAERLTQLELRCLMGEFNKVQARADNGQFSQKRKRRPRRSKRLYRMAANDA